MLLCCEHVSRRQETVTLTNAEMKKALVVEKIQDFCGSEELCTFFHIISDSNPPDLMHFV
jgi:hypothetical protein